jgi:hypothetical protein
MYFLCCLWGPNYSAWMASQIHAPAVLDAILQLQTRCISLCTLTMNLRIPHETKLPTWNPCSRFILLVLEMLFLRLHILTYWSCAKQPPFSIFCIMLGAVDISDFSCILVFIFQISKVRLGEGTSSASSKSAIGARDGCNPLLSNDRVMFLHYRYCCLLSLIHLPTRYWRSAYSS